MRLHASDLDFDRIRDEFGLPDAYPSGAEREAASCVDRHADSRRDATDIEFVTIDPPGSMDLDQAVHVEETDSGHRVRYAIADVGALVEPGSELEEESLRRGQTVYLPDGRVTLHPTVLSEGLASLLPDQTRPARGCCVLSLRRTTRPSTDSAAPPPRWAWSGPRTRPSDGCSTGSTPTPRRGWP